MEERIYEKLSAKIEAKIQERFSDQQYGFDASTDRSVGSCPVALPERKLAMGSMFLDKLKDLKKER